MIRLAGTWTFTQGSATAVGVDTQALTAVFIGDSISINREDWYRVLTIASDTSITFEPAFVETTAAGAQGWLLPVSTSRINEGSLSAQLTDLRQRYSEVMVVSGADRRITLNKTASTDFSEIIHQAGGVNKFKTGLIADNEWALMAFINGAWANVLKTVTTGVNPSQAVSLAYALAIGVGLGTVALPGMAFVGRPDTGLWSPAAATLAASAGGVEVWRSTASLITLAQNVKLSKASPIFEINAAAAGQERLLLSYTNNVLRWRKDIGDATAESGANAGSDYYLRAYSDAGTLIGNALSVMRASMMVSFGGVVALQAGIAALPSLTPTGDLNTGLWAPAADTLAWSTNGVERLRLANALFSIASSVQVSIPNGTISVSLVTGGLVLGGGLGVGGQASVNNLSLFGTASAVNIIDFSNQPVLTVATGANAALATILCGEFFIFDTTSTSWAKYVGDAGTAYVLLANGGGMFVDSTTTPAAGKISIAFDGTSTVRIYNNRGSTSTFRVCASKAR